MFVASKPTNCHQPVRCRAFWLPKAGHFPEHYEDAFAADEAAGRFAIADGASESVFAELWARLLVEDFVRQPYAELRDWHGRLPKLQHQWQETLRDQALPWYAEQKVMHGSFATFLGVEVRPDVKALRWQAVAVGDSCLFHTRDDRLLCAWPLETAQQFNNVPLLVGSRTPPEEVNYHRALWKLPQSGAEEQLQLISGDRLWLATDALAQWILAEHEAGRCPWRQMEDALPPPGENSTPWQPSALCDSAVSQCVGPADPRQAERSADAEAFERWIGELRRTGSLRNDDVTLLEVWIR